MIDLISKHLQIDNLDLSIHDIDSICAFSGEKIHKGVEKKDLIKDTFTDQQYLKYNSDYVSVDVALTMANVIPGKTRPNSLRNYSFISNSNELKLLKNNELMGFIVNPVEPPFIFCISFNNKKHLAFKANANYSVLNYSVTTDFGDCLIEKSKIDEILPVIEKWYTIIPEKADTKAEPTYFTKEEILNGSRNYKKIESYPGNYFNEDKIIQKFRNTMFLKILVHSLTKKS